MRRAEAARRAEVAAAKKAAPKGKAVVDPKAGKAKGAPAGKAVKLVGAPKHLAVPPKAAIVKRPAAASDNRYNGVPHWNYENSRGQIMCMTGLARPGQSHAIKFEVAGSKAKAVAMASAWVAKKKKEMGIKG